MTVMSGVTEYAEEEPVELVQSTGSYRDGVPDSERPGFGRWVVRALNEGGHKCTEVDVLHLVAWLKEHRPDLLETPKDY